MFSGLYTQPACAPVNASRRTSRYAAHDSGSGRFATPFLYDSFIHYSTTVSPAHPDAIRPHSPNRRGARRIEDLVVQACGLSQACTNGYLRQTRKLDLDQAWVQVQQEAVLAYIHGFGFADA